MAVDVEVGHDVVEVAPHHLMEMLVLGLDVQHYWTGHVLVWNEV